MVISGLRFIPVLKSSVFFIWYVADGNHGLGATAGLPSSAGQWKTLLGKPAVAPTSESVITFENCYIWTD